MKRKRIDFNYTPLKIMSGLYVATDVSTRQTFIAATGTYSPDYAKTVTDDKGVVTYVSPLIVKLTARVFDRDGIVPNGPINSSLTNVTFKMNDGGTITTLQTDTNYEVIATGDNAGTIKIKKNLPVNKAIELMCSADFIDIRTGQVHKINERISLFCGVDNANEHMYLDGGSSLYDPCEYTEKGLSQAKEVSITAHHKCGDIATTPNADRLMFVWRKQRSDGSFSEIGNSVLDYDCKVSGDSGETITIDRSLMGDRITLRCYALFSASGDVASKSISNATPMKTLTITRRMPKYDYDCSGLPSEIPAGLKTVYPSIVITTPQGSIENEDELFYFQWYAGTNNHGDATPTTLVASGKTVPIDTKYIVDGNGMLIGYDVVERGALKAMTDSDGAILVDSDGAIMIC